MPKENTAAVAVASTVRELLPIKPNAVCPDVVGHYTKSLIINMPDEITPQDISDHPEIFRTVQKSQDNRGRLNALDTVRFVWLDKIATATVDHATGDKVYFTKMEIKHSATSTASRTTMGNMPSVRLTASGERFALKTA